jgi:hypothetical protein
MGSMTRQRIGQVHSAPTHGSSSADCSESIRCHRLQVLQRRGSKCSSMIARHERGAPPEFTEETSEKAAPPNAG